MKEINIYIRGTCKNTGSNEELKEGSYIALLEYKGRFKQYVGKDTQTTSNRMLITALIKGIQLLKEPCIINLYTPTPLGFKSWKGSPNKDLLKEVIDLIQINCHEINEYISKDKQNYLAKVLKNI